MGEEIKKAWSIVGCWMAMISAEREILGDPPVPDDTPVLNFMGSGASCTVYWGDLKKLGEAINGNNVQK